MSLAMRVPLRAGPAAELSPGQILLTGPEAKRLDSATPCLNLEPMGATGWGQQQALPPICGHIREHRSVAT